MIGEILFMLGFNFWTFICKLKNYYYGNLNTSPKTIKELNGRIDWFNNYFGIFNNENYLQSATLPDLVRGDIVLAELGFNIGMEFGGKHYCIVLRDSPNTNKRVLILPITSQKPSDYNINKDLYVEFLSIRCLNRYKDRFSLNRHKRWCNILNVRSISKSRIIYPNDRNLPLATNRIPRDKLSEISNKIISQIALRDDLILLPKKYKKLEKNYILLQEKYDNLVSK